MENKKIDALEMKLKKAGYVMIDELASTHNKYRETVWISNDRMLRIKILEDTIRVSFIRSYEISSPGNYSSTEE